MATDYGISDEGYTAPRAADFLTLIRSAFEERTGLVIEWDNDTFLGNLTAIMAEQLGDLAEASQAVYDAFDVNNATGLQLDNLALLVGVTRTEATYSTVLLTLTGTSGTIIREGALVQGGGPDGTTRWATTEDVTISGGTATVIAQAEDPGAVEADAGELTTIVTPFSGWTSVTNADPATAGEERESDAALRKRRQQSLQTGGSRSLNAIRAAILALDGVEAATVIENTSIASAVVEGLTLAAKSIAVIVYPSTLTDDQKAGVAQAIYETIPAGISTNGTDVVATVTGLDGFSKTVKFDYASALEVDVAITVNLADGYELEDVEEPVQEAVSDYFLTLGVGDAVRRLSILALVAAIDGIDGAVLLLNGGAVDIVPDTTEYPTLGDNTVEE